MPIRRSHNKRSSERDVALVQMQIAAQTRNGRWHDFLCAKRDELQARLRQQGYSGKTGGESHFPDGNGRVPAGHAIHGTDDITAPDEVASPGASSRWGVAAPEAPEVVADSDVENAAWWNEKYADPS
ncbi:MAG: hypothetical protein IVW55_00500 [Chloroflexi bacterium]|nr:hypothetical protein [Chloroflexota bacterium]